MNSLSRKFVAILLMLLPAAPGWADQVWIDVRSAEEYAADHIDGDVHIPLAQLDTAALATQYGKDAEIVLYCRSGNRAGQAQALLQAAGFSKVSNAGGIAAVRTQRSIAVPAAPGPAGNVTATGAVAAPDR